MLFKDNTVGTLFVNITFKDAVETTRDTVFMNFLTFKQKI